MVLKTIINHKSTDIVLILVIGCSPIKIHLMKMKLIVCKGLVHPKSFIRYSYHDLGIQNGRLWKGRNFCSLFLEVEDKCLTLTSKGYL